MRSSAGAATSNMTWATESRNANSLLPSTPHNTAPLQRTRGSCEAWGEGVDAVFARSEGRCPAFLQRLVSVLLGTLLGSSHVVAFDSWARRTVQSRRNNRVSG